MPAAVNHPQKILETTDVELGLNDLVPFFSKGIHQNERPFFHLKRDRQTYCGAK